MPPPRRPGPKSGSGVKRPSIKAKNAPAATSSITTTREEHFQEVTRALSFLRKSEDQTDLRFVMEAAKTPPGPGRKSVGASKEVIVYGHKALFAQHSELLREIFEITEKKQPGHQVYISLPGVDPAVMEKVMQYLYLGQTTLSKEVREKVQSLCKQLKLNISIDEETTSAESADPNTDSEEEKNRKTKSKEADKEEEEEVQQNGKKKVAVVETPPSKRRASGPVSAKKVALTPAAAASKAKKTSPAPSSSEDEVETSVKLPLNEEAKLIEEAKKANPKVNAEWVEKSKDEEVKRYYKRATSGDCEPEPAKPALAANPLFSKSAAKTLATTPTTQKRRMAESDKKVASKESKKMRQDSESGSNSEVDAEAVAKRKKEALLDKKADREEEKKDSSDEDDGGEKNVTPIKKVTPVKKTKPGPKTKKAGPKSAKIESDLFVTEAVQYCGDCDAIFLSVDALKSHRDNKHAYEGGPTVATAAKATDESDPASTDSSEDEKCASRLATKANKKTPAKIKKERNQSKRASSSSSKSSDDEADDAAPKKTAKSSSGKVVAGNKKPGPGRHKKAAAAASSDDDVTPSPCKKAATPSAPKPKTPKTPRTPGGGGGGAHCRVCSHFEEKKAGMKNHVVNHYKQQLYAVLPSCKPFACPDCGSHNRDKVTLLRHYAFTHKHILEYCTEEDLSGKPVGDSDGDELPPPSKKAASSSNGLSSSAAKKKKVAPTKVTSKEQVHSSPSSSDSEQEKKKKRKEVDKDEEEKEGKEENGAGDKAGGSLTATVKFSDDSDDDFSNAAANANQTAKSFDDLFAGGGSTDDKEKSKGIKEGDEDKDKEQKQEEDDKSEKKKKDSDSD